ncbi:blue (type1) copper domain-containing protein [Candidatus Nitrosopumilus koreensis AR1]|uniref:Blue (Type1) copper domain-containing protein n=1 Tax=Candidatus Nitrosopumilus koreensis AR1 TaxID=1229908 RepID=K0B895_9ARCH|nr:MULTISPECIES: plastocyanin/azurin family copper-binding protein [Nitrosopumilus]AFS81190.1 blue (type1) copper domain-containing protein [Candidatus Nitrosopumilus koreensis AR1]
MAGIDKAAIGWSIAIVVIGVAIAFAGQSGQDLSIAVNTPTIVKDTASEMTSATKEVVDPFADIAAKVKENPKEVMKEAEKATSDIAKEAEEVVEDIGETIKEETEKHAPGPETHTVNIPAGTSVPGCEETNACYLPADIIIFAGDTVEWVNGDTAAHTVTGGSPADGPSGVFDSSLVMGSASYSFTFNDAGSYDYFCMVHPWMVGNVQVN